MQLEASTASFIEENFPKITGLKSTKDGLLVVRLDDKQFRVMVALTMVEKAILSIKEESSTWQKVANNAYTLADLFLKAGGIE